MEARVDKLNRRFRFSPPQPKGKHTVIDADDIKMWTAIHAHGPLPTHYLHAFIDKRDFNNHQHRLTKLRNGTATDGPFLVRCPIDSPDPLSTVSVYKLHKNAEEILKEKGIFSFLAERKGWNIHQLMGSCITASIELACREKGITFIPRHVILSANNKPLKFAVSNTYLVPDELFGLDDGKQRFFVCEWDRNSEPFKRDKSDGVDFVSKLNDYLTVMQNGGFRKHTKVLIVTTSTARANSIREHLKDSPFAHRFIVDVLDYFAHPWRMPPILKDVNHIVDNS